MYATAIVERNVVLYHYIIIIWRLNTIICKIIYYTLRFRKVNTLLVDINTNRYYSPIYNTRIL